ncbi:MAG: GAK system XXXCH domain-containing protein [Candidatus Scalindua sp.]|nr:GAK system XXXCH domain-containing protein [Candidatus Scalindua sp.]
MSEKKKKNLEFSLSVKETAENLRKLADELERGVVSISEEEFDIAPDTRVMIDLNSKNNKVSFKLKCKLANQLAHKKVKPLIKDKRIYHTKKSKVKEQQSKQLRDNALEEYTILKKRMSKDFGAIMKSCIKEQSLPKPILIERFYRDSKAMCNYPDKGEEFYKTYLNQAESLNKAFKNSDLQAMNYAVTTLNRLKKECHERYK